MVPSWWYGALFALLLLQLFAVYAGARRARRSTVGDRDADGAVDETEGVVSCPTCGAENDLGYRFCRRCVDELPGSSPYRVSNGAPRSRGMF